VDWERVLGFAKTWAGELLILLFFGLERFVRSRSDAHQGHAKARVIDAEASAREMTARKSLDAATREWAERLVHRYDQENEELRAEVAAARAECVAEREALKTQHEREMKVLLARYDQERDEWQCQMTKLREEMTVLKNEYERLREENAALRILLVRSGVNVGTGPLDPSVIGEC